MPESLSLLDQPRPKIKKKSAASLLVVLPIAGLIAGLLTASLDFRFSPVKVPGLYGVFARGLYGVLLGVTLAIALAVGGVLRGFGALWKPLPIAVFSSCAYLVSYWAAIGVELA